MTKCATVGQKLAVDLDDVTESNLTKTVNVFYHDFGRIELHWQNLLESPIVLD